MAARFMSCMFAASPILGTVLFGIAVLPPTIKANQRVTTPIGVQSAGLTTKVILAHAFRRQSPICFY